MSSPTTLAPRPETHDTAVCAVCPHPLSEHDAIGVRFCAATTDGAFDRGCVCRS